MGVRVIVSVSVVVRVSVSVRVYQVARKHEAWADWLRVRVRVRIG